MHVARHRHPRKGGQDFRKRGKDARRGARLLLLLLRTTNFIRAMRLEVVEGTQRRRRRSVGCLVTGEQDEQQRWHFQAR